MILLQAGIGTYESPQVATPLGAKISKTLDEMIAWNLSSHVMDGYEFLMQNYKAGDRICIFGFSRGAYTARGLAGMIHKVGLLPACNFNQVPFAYKMYTRADETGWKQSNAFKKAFSVDVPIEFIGVWDTVNSVGLIPHRLPFTTSNTIVRTFRHAVSLDEHRAKFKANLWHRPTVTESTLGVQGQKPDVPETIRLTSSAIAKLRSHGKSESLQVLEERYSGQAASERPTDVEEVHVGGGSVENGTPHTLARIPLRWMIRECFKADSGIMFMSDGIRSVGLDPATLYPFVKPRPPPIPLGGAQLQNIPSAATQLQNFSGMDSLVEVTKTEEEQDLLDAMSPIYDQLSLAPAWWILEVLPLIHRYQRSNNSWTWYIRPNLGDGRVIPDQKKKKIKIHRTVKMRLDAQYPNGTKYKPKASFDVALALGNVEWID
ncbi:hypothetical protein H0H92_009974 [Tricholoma furcatifolium]|nr:hypothetical protein H0H92_009974 [Tricholoma furcatifolium]